MEVDDMSKDTLRKYFKRKFSESIEEEPFKIYDRVFHEEYGKGILLFDHKSACKPFIVVFDEADLELNRWDSDLEGVPQNLPLGRWLWVDSDEIKHLEE